MSPREYGSAKGPQSTSLESSSAPPQGHTQSLSTEQEIAAIVDFLNSNAAKRADALLHPEETSAPPEGISEPVPPAQAPVSGPVETNRSKREEVIYKIEIIFGSFVDAIREDRELTVVLSSRRSSSGPSTQQETQQSESTSSASCSREIRFPGSTGREAWKFTVVVRILQLIHEALVDKVVATKRDIFYKDPELFIKQPVVDQFVDDIAATFGVDRASLNVVSPAPVAAAKGLVLGPLRVTRCDSSVLDCAADKEGTLIPNVKEIQNLDISEIRWVLVIEKEATFRSLAASKFWQTPMMGKGLLITVTAKGYPDISTRHLLHLLSTHPSLQEHQRPPLYALVDFDPDGIAIMSTYKHGSIALAHENAQLRIPTLKRLGIRSKDIMMLDLADDETGLLRLTLRDRKKACTLLGNKALQGEWEEAEWRNDLRYMLMLNVKAEMQILSNLEGGLEQWLEREITAQYLSGE